LLSVRSLLGAVAVTPPKKKKKKNHTENARPHWLNHCFQSITFATDNHMPEVDMRLQCGPHRYGPEEHSQM